MLKTKKLLKLLKQFFTHRFKPLKDAIRFVGIPRKIWLKITKHRLTVK